MGGGGGGGGGGSGNGCKVIRTDYENSISLLDVKKRQVGAIP